MALSLHGPTLALRLPEPGDAPALLELAGDPEVTRWFSWGPYRGVDEPLAWIERQPALRDSGTQLDFVILADGRAAGVTGLGELSRRDRRAMVGTWLGREHWGSGVNSESKALVAHLAFHVCGMERLGAYSNPDNARSAAALERLGFSREGRLRSWHRHGDRVLDVDVYGLLRSEWETSRLAAVPVTVEGRPPPAWLPRDRGV